MAAPDVVVIGGGIVGTAAAAFLAEGGASVLLVERDTVAAGASGRNSGVVQQPFDRALAPLYRDTVREYRRLAQTDLGFTWADEPAGLLLLARDGAIVEAEAAAIRKAQPRLPVEVLDPEATRRLEPALAAGVWAVRIPTGHPVPPAAATRAFARLAERRGVRVAVGTAARPWLDPRGERLLGIALADVGRIACGAVLVAAGPLTSTLIDPTGRWRPVRSLWGVVLEVALSRPPRHVLEEAAIGGVTSARAGVRETTARRSRPGGARGGVGTEERRSVGSTAEGGSPEVGFSLVTAEGTTSLGSTFLPLQPDPLAWAGDLRQRGARYVPSLKFVDIVGTRVCARPVSADGRPLLGPVPGLEGLFVAAGHGPWGISTGPGSARLVADAILGRPSSIPAALAAERFGLPGIVAAEAGSP
ncbi:MAG TPA: FAD-dependent oxidoreductase [Candidatus Binatia bacterium]|nr:FAD-dependent oxidoreductase [Candidatus Binatia bacterium]